MTWLRHPLLSATALAVYLAVNLGAGGLHHHTETLRSETDRVADGLHLEPAHHGLTQDSCDEDGCLFCRVLHLAGTISLVVRFDAVVPAAGKAVAITPLARPYPIEKATQSRAPPSVS